MFATFVHHFDWFAIEKNTKKNVEEKKKELRNTFANRCEVKWLLFSTYKWWSASADAGNHYRTFGRLFYRKALLAFILKLRAARCSLLNLTAVVIHVLYCFSISCSIPSFQFILFSGVFSRLRFLFSSTFVLCCCYCCSQFLSLFFLNTLKINCLKHSEHVLLRCLPLCSLLCTNI